VKSVGKKTAAQLIEAYGSLPAILAAAADMPGRVGEALRVHADDARLSLRLAMLRTDVEVGLNLSACRVTPPDMRA
jgi:DNA polymerase-1